MTLGPARIIANSEPERETCGEVIRSVPIGEARR